MEKYFNDIEVQKKLTARHVNFGIGWTNEEFAVGGPTILEKLNKTKLYKLIKE